MEIYTKKSKRKWNEQQYLLHALWNLLMLLSLRKTDLSRCAKRSKKKCIEIQIAKVKEEEEEKTMSRNLITFSEQKLINILQMLDLLIIFFVISDVIYTRYSNTRYTSNHFDLNHRLVKVITNRTAKCSI